jgi:thiamine-monophosphate kinase
MGTALTRSGAQAGDLVYVSGTIGDGALGLMALRGDLSGIGEADRGALVERYHLPRPRLALGQVLAAQRLATAALDVSDGLVADMGHIATESGLAARIEAGAVPLSAAARTALGRDRSLREAILTGGDDYELLFTASSAQASAIAALAGPLDLPLSRIGAMAAGTGVRVVDETGAAIPLTKTGWTHL